MASMRDALKRYFGFSEFRPLQREIVEAAMAGRDVFALMPTGAGKSLCFQLPAAMLPGVTIVISPLIALMKDQVDAMTATGIPATFLNSSLDGHEVGQRMRDLQRGRYKLLYLAPERFPVPGFLDFLQALNVSLCVVDEAHCISEWGHDFRVDYRNLRVLRESFPKAPIMAVTATATDRVAQDILTQLRLRDTQTFRASFDRKNLIYQVWPKRAAMLQLTGYLESKKGDSGIVYCLSRAGTEKMAEALQARGHHALAYHAGLERNERTRVQDLFDRDKIDIVCATIAFGMGIDKPNVRYVIHYDLPKSIPSYYQETGRAGRDGLASDCILFYQNGDRQKYVQFFDDKPPEERVRAIQELDKLIDLIETNRCRRKTLLGYFGEEYGAQHCGTCDNCLSTQSAEEFDGTRLAQMFLSCVERLRRQDQTFGAAHIVNILRGLQEARILDWRHHELPTFGVGKEYPKAEWQHYANEFRRQGLIVQDHEQHSVVKMTQAGYEVLKGARTVMLARPKHIESVGRDAIDLPAENRLLFEELRKLRRRLAEAQGVPPYIIFNDYTLKEIAARVPRDGREFRTISGVGDSKAKQYGLEFLACIRNFHSGHRELKKLDVVKHALPEPKGGDSAMLTLELFQRGDSPKQIAEERAFALSTIFGHIASLLQSGHLTSLERLVDDTKAAAIRTAMAQSNILSLTEIREKLGEAYSFEEIRFVRAFDEWRRVRTESVTS